MDIAIHQIEFFAAARKHKIIGSAFAVSEKITLDGFAVMPQAQDEVLVPEVRVVFHDAPEDRAIACTIDLGMSSAS